MIEQNELAFGNYYKHIRSGKKQQFINTITEAMGMSCCYWQQHFVEWSRGIIRGKRMDKETKHKIAVAITGYLQSQTANKR